MVYLKEYGCLLREFPGVIHGVEVGMILFPEQVFVKESSL
jgi:hypothetical protein